jgi:2-iminobutanoate/2-iminopropanoate deaminase
MELIQAGGGPPPAEAAFSSAVALAAGTRTLYLSGQTGRRPDGNIPSDAAEQCEQMWRRVLELLREQGLGPQDIVRIQAYVTAAVHLPAYQTSRKHALKGHLPASTTVIVSGLVHPELLVELDVIAAYPT